MHRIATGNFKLLIIGILIVWIASGCTSGPDHTSDPPGKDAYPIDSHFREFYNLLGGEKVLGVAISPVMEFGTTMMQYTEAALMRYDSLATAAQRYSLAPVGNDLHVSDPAISLPDQTTERIVDGYIIYDEFVSIYDSLQGARFAGKPLTQVRIDYERGRIEQYFENVGFYRMLSETQGTVHLLAYGAWKCESACHFQGRSDARISPQPVFPEPLVSTLARFGSGFTGRPISGPYLADDGQLEQIYQNFVIAADPNNLRMISIRPITAEAGYPPTALVPKVEDDRMVFYPIKPGLGHNVPKVLEQYITEHGGLELSGMPTTEVFQVGDIYRQCFTNYCLDYDPGASEALRIRPAPLGETYLKLHNPSQEAEQSLEVTPAVYRLNVWEERGFIAPEQEQKIHLEVTEAGSQTPIPDIEATLTLYYPEGSEKVYHFQPTDPSGQSSVSIPAINAINGTLIPYQVCLGGSSNPSICVKDTYVIWGGR